MDCLKRTWSCLRENKLKVALIGSAIVGLIFGFILKYGFDVSPKVVTYIGLPGALLIQAFSMLIVPLIICALATGVAQTKRGQNKKLIGLTFALFIGLTVLATVYGMLLITIISPGTIGYDHSQQNEQEVEANVQVPKKTSTEDSLFDVLRNAIPPNIFEATMIHHYTSIIPVQSENGNGQIEYKKKAERAYGANFIGLCVFSLILGFAILALGERAKTIKSVLEEMTDIIMYLMDCILPILPIGMFCWMCEEVFKMKSPEALLIPVLSYMGLGIVALLTHCFGILPLIYFLVVRKNPLTFCKNLFPTIVMAFGTSSSALSLPMTLKCMEEKNKCDPSVTRFVCPLGMNVHMNGTSMYMAMVAIFVAQVKGVSVAIHQFLAVCIYSVLMGMALPGTPSTGGIIVNYLILLQTLNITDAINILVLVMTSDWLSSRIRTFTNVVGDCYVAALVEKVCAGDTKEEEKPDGTEAIALNSVTT